MNVFFISDLHFGHTGILKFSPQRGEGKVQTIEQHDDWIVSQWNSVVKPKDQVWVLGDICFHPDSLHHIERLNGTKHLVRGNHCPGPTRKLLQYFREVHGIVKKYGFWLTHAPVHPQELRGLRNIHGHVHHNSVRLDNRLDDRYINVCVEALNGIPINLQEIRKL